MDESDVSHLLLAEPVVTLSRAGAQVLLSLRKAPCAHCRHGERVETVWGSGGGEGSRISWCRSCFNADTVPVELDRRLRRTFRAVLRRLGTRPPARTWSCARPAIDYLEAQHADR